MHLSPFSGAGRPGRGRGVRGQGERGATAAVFALVLTSLLTVTSLTVDLSRAYVERRHDQNAVDVAVMSGVVVAALDGDVGAIVDEVRARVDATLQRPVSDEAWEACVDADHLEQTVTDLAASDPAIGVATECISFDATFSAMRVRLPEQEVPSIFAAVVGLDAISTSASAQAGVSFSTGRGAQPFVAFRGAGAGDFVCMRSGGSSGGEPEVLLTGNGPGPHPEFAPTPDPALLDPCDSRNHDVASSSFGTIRPHAYRTDRCGTSNEEVRLAIMLGADHPFSAFPGGFSPGIGGVDSRTRIDGDDCVPFPNTLVADSGFDAKVLDCALIAKGSKNGTCVDVTPLLRQGGNWEESTTTVVGERFDNTAPWSLLRPAADLFEAGAPDACVLVAAARPGDDFDLAAHDTFDEFTEAHPNHGDEYWDHYDRFDSFVRCLGDWAAPGPVLFADEVVDAPRFALVPQVDEETISGPAALLHIEGFVPMYLYRVYIGANKQVMCDLDDPREATKYLVQDAGNDNYPDGACGASNQSVDRVAGLLYACGMVPSSVCSKSSDVGGGSALDIYDFELTG